MKKRIFAFVSLMLMFGASFVHAESLKAKHSITLIDAEGDVKEQHGGHPGKDVVKLVIKSDGKNMQVAVSLKKDIAHYLEGHLAGGVLTVNFDTDNNAKTGGKTFWGGKTGFEYEVSLLTCIKYERGEACGGGLKKPSVGFFATIDTKKYTQQGKTDTKDIHDIFWKSPRKDIKGNKAVFTIPYSEIGAASGKTVRIVIRESDSSFDEKSFFPDILFTLK